MVKKCKMKFLAALMFIASFIVGGIITEDSSYIGATQTYAQVANEETKVSSALEKFTTQAQMTDFIQMQILNRNKQFQCVYVSKESQAQAKKTIDDAIINSMKHTGKPNEGDYLHWNYGGYKFNMSGSSMNGVTWEWTITFTFDLYTTKEQEALFESRANTVLNSLKLDGKSDYEKVKLIYEYICNNVTYDYEGLNNGSSLSRTGYSALINGKAVCQGYSNLFYYLLLKEGIDCRIVAGRSSNQNHGWNIVKLDSKYYFCDTTWDAPRKDNREYFLRGSSNFADHVLNGEYLTSTFSSEYPISTTDYKPSTTVSACTVTKVSNVSTGVKVEWKKVAYSTGYYVYRKSGSGSYKKIATIKRNSTLSYIDKTAKSGTTYTYMVKAFDSSQEGKNANSKSIKFVGAAQVNSVTNGTSGLYVKWGKVAGAKGYYIYRKEGSKAFKLIKTIKNVNTVSYTDKAVTASKRYTYKIVPFNGSYKGTSRNQKAYVRVGSTKITSLKNNAASKAQVKYNKVTGASKYKVEVATDKKFTNKKIYTFSGKSSQVNISSLKKGKTYYIRVRACKVINKVSYYGAYTALKSVKITR